MHEEWFMREGYQEVRAATGSVAGYFKEITPGVYFAVRIDGQTHQTSLRYMAVNFILGKG